MFEIGKLVIHMICVQLKGGLGNQLYQYACGRALSNRIGTELILDISILLRHNKKITSRNFGLDWFDFQAKIAGPFTISPAVFKYIPSLSGIITPFKLYVERSDKYDSGIFSVSDNTYLLGYWQSYKYFNKISAELIKDFGPRISMSEGSLFVDANILSDSEQSVAVHIRRGDYVSLASASNYHGVLAMSYYHSAVNYIRGTVRSPKFFVFSDDIEWCKSNLNLNTNEVVFSQNSTNVGAWEDLHLMSHCRHIIMANSSFSWWAAWLGDQYHSARERLVIAPTRWFAGSDQNLSDRIPPHWILI